MSQPIIKCKHLSHAYSGVAALNNISFDVFAGEPIGLVGPNGAGKTTLFNILCGFIHPTSGEVALFNHKPSSSALTGKVSALPQDARLDPNFTINEQLIFYARLQGFNANQARIETIRVLEAVGLKDSLNEKPTILSHGMGKRVAIAQALIGKPKLIFLDEPTAGLDPINIRNIRSVIAEHSSHTTFIISSHDLTELGRLCQKILLLNKGVMSTMSFDNTDQNSTSLFLTLQLEPCSAPDVIKIIQQLNGVLQVTNPQKNEFIIEYNPTIEPKIDIKIIHCLAENNWQYRQFSRGKTMEQQLFFEEQ